MSAIVNARNNSYTQPMPQFRSLGSLSDLFGDSLCWYIRVACRNPLWHNVASSPLSFSLFVCFPWGHYSSFLFEVSAALVVVAVVVATTQRRLSLFFTIFHIIFIYSFVLVRISNRFVLYLIFVKSCLFCHSTVNSDLKIMPQHSVINNEITAECWNGLVCIEVSEWSTGAHSRCCFSCKLKLIANYWTVHLTLYTVKVKEKFSPCLLN
jgi:hypothetical protein